MLDLVDLNPDAKVFTSVGDLIFKLRLFDLHAVVWAESFFPGSEKRGFNAMYNIINSDVTDDNIRVFNTVVANVSFYLAEDLKIKTIEEFTEKIKSNGPEKSIAILSESIKKVLKKSFPQDEKETITGGDIFNETTKDEKPESTNWAKVIGDFYRLSGTTIDQFYSLTMLQIDAIYSQIDEGRNREKVEMMRFHGAIHGVKEKDLPKMPLKKADAMQPDEKEEIRQRHKKLFNR